MNSATSMLNYLDNPVIWGILALALACYVLLLNFLLAERNDEWIEQTGTWLKVLPVLLGVLPLLGLLGTINGLLSTFNTMGISGSLDQQTLLSSGIAEALITTQLGLVTLIPGLLLLTVLRGRFRRFRIYHEKPSA